ncbi:Cytidine deaminase [Enterococcus sp. HSIEG1]|nr:Cytidine deaminase [Enterococcus sp. HSIEG1]
MTKAKKEWIETAVAALDKAYVPYSKFPVGACLVTKKEPSIKASISKMLRLA